MLCVFVRHKSHMIMFTSHKILMWFTGMPYFIIPRLNVYIYIYIYIYIVSCIAGDSLPLSHCLIAQSVKNLQPTPVFLPRKSHGQRRLVGHSPWGHKIRTWLSDWATETTHTHTHTHICIYIYILFQILFHYRLVQDTEYSSLCYKLGPCLPILYIVMCIY